MGRTKKKERSKIEDNKTDTREKMANALELPKEIVLNIPKVIVLGNKSVVIQNYKGVFLFEDETIKINTSSGILVIYGHKLKINEINSEDLSIEGRIKSIEFMN